MTPAGARELRRQVGPVAWAAFCDLLEEARPAAPGEQLVVETNARRLAVNLGVSKDTAARALRRLADAGLVEALPVGRADGGRFGRASYRVSPRSAVVELPVATIPRESEPVVVADGRSRRRSGNRNPDQQPSLFEVG